MDTLLRLSATNIPDLNILEQHWIHAARLTGNFLKDRYPAVLADLGER